MEFGCCTQQGAEEKGGIGWAIVDWKKEKPELKNHYVRDEDVQAKCLTDLLRLFENEDVYTAFVFTFVSYSYPYNSDPRYDLDMASYGIVRTIQNSEQGFEGLNWLPKKAFFHLADYYKGIQP